MGGSQGNAATQLLRVLPSGWKETYGGEDNAVVNNGSVSTWRIFLTRLEDPQGNAVILHYDTNHRLVSITDTLGQVTNLSYDNPTFPLNITRVTDPFGRSASFTYDTNGELASTTDVMGMQSQFTYGFTFPYGTKDHGADASYVTYGDWMNIHDHSLWHDLL